MFFPDLTPAFRDALTGLRGQRIAVAGHLRPDGDCIGSQVGLTRMLRAQGFDACAVNGDAIPRVLKDFVGDTPFVTPDALPEGEMKLLTVDCADELRHGRPLRERFGRVDLGIDHHISNTHYAGINLVDPHAAATAEILTGLFLDLGWEMDATTAQALYVGIATDTGQFRFPSTTPQVFEICSALIAQGAQPAEAALELYENETVAKLALLQRFLASLRLLYGERVCIGTLRATDFLETGAHSEDTEGLVDYARSISTVQIGVLLEEREDGVKGSFRAKDARFRVDQLAAALDGGGHACAAGFLYKGKMDTLYPRLLELIENQLRQAG